ncbi:MAG TPA: thiolase domain-containing protein [Methanocella sp.]|nr:thiolase domain-containing protein [Methanocella sp.]
MYITGAGRTKFGVLPQTMPELAYEAMNSAIDDANADVRDIGAIFVSNFIGGPLNGQLHLNSLVASLLPGTNVPIVRVETACASSSTALRQAIFALDHYDMVMVLGVEKMNSRPIIGITEAIAMASDRQLDQASGMIFPASYALIAQQYMRRYGIGHEVLEQVSLINHQNSRSNPLAHFYYKDVTLETIRKSPVVATPLNLFDCSPISDGAVALVLSRKRRSPRDIRILSSQYSTDTLSPSQRRDMTSFAATKIAAHLAYQEAGIRPEDVDLAEVHDCFTISELVALDDLGFSEPGRAPELIMDGQVLRDGSIPVNMDGGLKADGHPIGATGLAQLYELMIQLRNEADVRQVSDARIGLAQNIGGIGGTAAVTLLGRD